MRGRPVFPLTYKWKPSKSKMSKFAFICSSLGTFLLPAFYLIERDRNEVILGVRETMCKYSCVTFNILLVFLGGCEMQ